jgi:hypothetical protein
VIYRKGRFGVTFFKSHDLHGRPDKTALWVWDGVGMWHVLWWTEMCRVLVGKEEGKNGLVDGKIIWIIMAVYCQHVQADSTHTVVPPCPWVICSKIYSGYVKPLYITWYLCNKHKYGKVYLINNGFLNTNSAITWGLMGTARTVVAEWRKVLQESVCTGAKEDELSTGRVWDAGFHYVTARSRLGFVYF